MDDEGYTSPPEDCEFLYTSSNGHRRGQDDNNDTISQADTLSSFGDVGEDNGTIDWVEIAQQPVVKSSFIGWDDVPCPLPHRKQDLQNVNKRNKKLLSKAFLLENGADSKDFVNNIWKIPQAQPTDTEEKDDCVPLPNAVDLIKLSPQDPTNITLQDFIQHLLHLLCGRESQSFIFMRTGPTMMRKFQKNPSTLIYGMTPSSLDNYSQPFIRCGSVFRKLWLVAYKLTQEDVGFGDGSTVSTSGRTHSGISAIFVAFQRFIGDYLRLYETVLMLKGPSMKTLSKLSAFIKPLHLQLQILENIVDTKLTGNSVLLLTELNELLFTHDTPIVGDLLRGLFVTCASAYLKYISDWIFRGDLGPPSEFHIHLDGNRDQGYKDRRFWTKQFTQTEHLPQFLENSVGLIFETGKAICLFNSIKDARVSGYVSSSSLFSYDTDRILKAHMSFDGLQALNTEWNVKLSSFLQENSYLISAVHEAIQEVITDSLTKFVEIDLQAAQQTRLDFHSRADQSLKDRSIRAKEQQRNMHSSLSAQVKLVNKKKELDDDRDRAEDKRIAEFVARKDQEKLEQDKNFAMKYFGNTANSEGISRTPARISQEARSVAEALGSPANLLKSEPSDMLGSGDSSLPNSNRKSQVNDSAQIIGLLNEDDIPKFKPEAPKSSTTVKRSYVRKKRKEKTMAELMTHKYEDESSLETALVLAEGEERINPDKLIVRKPPPYEFNIDFKKPIMPWDTGTSTKPVESLIKDPNRINDFLSQSVLIPVTAQHRMVSSAILHHFITDEKLFHHLAALNDFLLLQNGMFGHFLNELLLEEVKRSSIKTPIELANRSGQLNLILREALSIAVESQENNHFLKNLSFTLVQEKNIPIKELLEPDNCVIDTLSDYQILNSLRLKYTVGWPLNIILTDEFLRYYENIFAVLMQLIRTESLLKKVFLHLKSKRSKSEQLLELNRCRHQMLVFVRTVRSYMNVTVIHTAWAELCSTFHQLNSLERIYDHLVCHIKSISANCLLGPRGGNIIRLLVRELVIIESFCSSLETICINSNVDWDNGEELSKRDFKALHRKCRVTSTYERLLLETAYKASNKGHHPNVTFFLELYDFNNFSKMRESLET